MTTINFRVSWFLRVTPELEGGDVTGHLRRR